MIILDESAESPEISITESDIESAVRQFICTCHPKFKQGYVINPKIKLDGNATIMVKCEKGK